MKLLLQVRSELARVADPARAPKMQAYMKSAMPYHGAASPVARAVFKSLLAPLSFADAATWAKTVLGLWRGAKFREERYAALYLAGVKGARAFQTPDALPLYEELITTGAWWDYVDDVAIHRVGPILREHPGAMRKRLLGWSRGDDLWKARTSIIAQNGFKKDTDLAFLEACIRPSIASTEFFLRKAIGWALREYAWTDPVWVKTWVAAHPELSGLSRREALKNV